MPHYRATNHAVYRLAERFPMLNLVAGQGLHALQWLSRVAARGRVVAQQAGMDLMLEVEMPTTEGKTRLYLPVSPRPGDTWIIRTVLTEAMYLANDMAQREVQRQAWRERLGLQRQQDPQQAFPNTRFPGQPRKAIINEETVRYQDASFIDGHHPQARHVGSSIAHCRHGRCAYRHTSPPAWEAEDSALAQSAPGLAGARTRSGKTAVR